MTAKSEHRRPAAFRLDDPHVVVAPPPGAADVEAPARRGRATVLVTPEPDAAAPPVAIAATAPRRRRFAWGALFWSALGGLVSLGLGLAVTRLIDDLAARAAWLGTLGLALAAAAGIALAAVVAREAVGIARLRTVEKLRARAAAVLASDDRAAARALVRDVLALLHADPRLARARAGVHGHLGDIIDGADLVRLAERELMTPLDAEARALVAAAAGRVSIVTAVSPRAAVDMAFVLISSAVLVRRLAELYGGRPGPLGLLRLLRLVVTHLALTGGISAGDSLIQQVLGHGVAAKLSARLGEGVLNGLLTARVGLAAIEVARPLPFAALAAPALGDLTGELIGRRGDKAGGDDAAP